MTEPAHPEPPVPARPPAEVDAVLLQAARALTPARILAGRSGPAYRTTTWLQLRQDHAAARDAVQAEIDLERDLGTQFVRRWNVFEVETLVGSKVEYLLRPDLGRRLAPAARDLVRERCPPRADVQIVIGDGLSAAAVRAQVPALLPRLVQELEQVGLTAGGPFFVRHCRVGVLNDVGELLDPAVAILLIGERPGLATAESLSAYLAYRPRPGDTDARRNLIANIHGRGVTTAEAARRLAALSRKLWQARQSGVGIKEEFAPQQLEPAPGSLPGPQLGEASKLDAPG
jgi:ethanolamine ammonia-lyase small subunit